MPAFSLFVGLLWAFTEENGPWLIHGGVASRTSAEPARVFKAEAWHAAIAQELHLGSNHITEPIYEHKSKSEGPTGVSMKAYSPMTVYNVNENWLFLSYNIPSNIILAL